MKKLIFTFAVIFAITLAAQVPDTPLLKVFDAAYRSNPRQNIMLSPWGIQQCFGMLTGWAPRWHHLCKFVANKRKSQIEIYLVDAILH